MLIDQISIFQVHSFEVMALVRGIIWIVHSAVFQLQPHPLVKIAQVLFLLMQTHSESLSGAEKEPGQNQPRFGAIYFSELTTLYNHHYKSVLEHFHHE